MTIVEQTQRRAGLVEGITQNDLDQWNALTDMTPHQRLLHLAWMVESRSELAVLWLLFENHRRLGKLGPSAAREESSNEAARLFGSLFGTSARSICDSMRKLIDSGVVRVHPHVDNVKREMWLHWPAVCERWLATAFPEQHVLELNWVAHGQRAAVAVLLALTEHARINPGAFARISARDIEAQYRPMLGEAVMNQTVIRWAMKLSASGLIERLSMEVPITKGMRLVPGALEDAVAAFYQLDVKVQ